MLADCVYVSHVGQQNLDPQYKVEMVNVSVKQDGIFMKLEIITNNCLG